MFNFKATINGEEFENAEFDFLKSSAARTTKPLKGGRSFRGVGLSHGAVSITLRIVENDCN